MKALFPRFLGDAFNDLPMAVQAGHAVDPNLVLMGHASVTRGSGIWARLLAKVFGFPPASDDVPVIVTMSAQGGGELWERCFGDKCFRSFLNIKDGKMTERFAPFDFTLDLHVSDGRLLYPVAAGRLGPVGLPKWMLPLSIAREYEADGTFHFDVALHAPLTGALMVHYKGWLLPAADTEPT